MAYGKIKADAIIYDNSGSDVEKTIASLASAAPTASPTFTGTVTIPTPTAGDNTTKAASTAFVVAGFAPKASPTFTGTINGAALTLSGNLQVNGTTTTVASSTMTVTDKNIEIAKGAANDAAADGAGITVDSGDGDKTWNWVDATDAWTSSEHINLVTGKYINVTNSTSVFNSTSNGAASFAIQAANNGTGTTMAGIGFTSGGSQKASIRAHVLGDGKMTFHNNNDSEKMVLSAGGALSVTSTVSDSKGDVRKIIQNTQGSTYTLVAADAGKHILASGTVTIPNSVFSAGDAVTIVNNTGGDLTLTASVGTLYNTADAATGNRTLATRGMATILFASATVAYISGAGLS